LLNLPAILIRALALLIGYVFGLLQTAFYVGKIIYKKDIREFGSKNSGATNAIRVFGWKPGLAVFIIDILKSVAAYFFCYYVFKNPLAGIYGGLGVIIGHDFPVTLRFKGGKGSASGIGLMLSANPALAVVSLLLGFAAVFFTRYISLASMLIASSFFVLNVIFDASFEVCAAFFAVAALSVYMHRANVKRLINKEENKLSFK
jgi:glycerol-3-phosphate acyltransferase PlsY